MEMNDCRQLEAHARTLHELPGALIYSTPNVMPVSPASCERDITFFVACYNEEGEIIETFGEIVKAMARFDWSWEIVVIDDASTDRSVELVQKYMCDHPDYPMMLVVRRENRGLGQNYTDAAFLGRGRYFKLVCGDNVDDSEQLASILCHIGKADMLLPYHSHTLNRTLFRRALSRAFTMAVNLVTGYTLRYYNGCGVHLRYNVIRWNANRPGFDFQADLVTRLLDQGKTYLEIPTIAGERAFGQSKALSVKNFASAIHFFLDLVIRRVAENRSAGR